MRDQYSILSDNIMQSRCLLCKHFIVTSIGRKSLISFQQALIRFMNDFEVGYRLLFGPPCVSNSDRQDYCSYRPIVNEGTRVLRVWLLWSTNCVNIHCTIHLSFLHRAVGDVHVSIVFFYVVMPIDSRRNMKQQWLTFRKYSTRHN